MVVTSIDTVPILVAVVIDLYYFQNDGEHRHGLPGAHKVHDGFVGKVEEDVLVDASTHKPTVDRVSVNELTD